MLGSVHFSWISLKKIQNHRRWRVICTENAHAKQYNSMCLWYREEKKIHEVKKNDNEKDNNDDKGNGSSRSTNNNKSSWIHPVCEYDVEFIYARCIDTKCTYVCSQNNFWLPYSFECLRILRFSFDFVCTISIHLWLKTWTMNKTNKWKPINSLRRRLCSFPYFSPNAFRFHE